MINNIDCLSYDLLNFVGKSSDDKKIIRNATEIFLSEFRILNDGSR